MRTSSLTSAYQPLQQEKPQHAITQSHVDLGDFLVRPEPIVAPVSSPVECMQAHASALLGALDASW
jgi:hypothetical protein